MGILLALTALFSWGLGDFLIQRSTRQFGNWIALFYITAFGTIILFPFVYRDLAAMLTAHLFLLLGTSVVVTCAALLEFEALRIGNISVIEPVYALEIPIAAVLAAAIIHETLSGAQIFFIAALVVGLFLVATRSFKNLAKLSVEQGVWIAALGTVFVGITNFLFGVGSRETSPLMVNWLTNAFIAIVTLVYIVATSQTKKIWRDFHDHPRLVFNVSFFDNLAWITFSYAMLFIPIAVATGISEGYIALASALGIIFNKERLRNHQWIGLILVAVSVIILALITDH